MKKNRQKTVDRSHHLGRLGAQQLACVRGGGIQGSGLAADNGVIQIQKEDGVIHAQ
jgi:hypothetical protein